MLHKVCYLKGPLKSLDSWMSDFSRENPTKHNQMGFGLFPFRGVELGGLSKDSTSPYRAAYTGLFHQNTYIRTPSFTMPFPHGAQIISDCLDPGHGLHLLWSG